MSDYADVEIGLSKFSQQDGSGYKVDLRFTQPGSDAEGRLLRGDPVVLHFDFAALKQLIHDDDKAYGRQLGESLWSAEPLRTAFQVARSSAQSLQAVLRVRLFVDSSAAELHTLHWEKLQDPETGGPLCSNENLLFSRYLSSNDLRPIDMRPMRDLKALVVIANPQGLGSTEPGGYASLAFIDVPGELKRARKGFGWVRNESDSEWVPASADVKPIPVVELCSDPANPGQASLTNIAKALRDGYDILYLVCHGAMKDDGPRLYLEDDTDERKGKVKVEEGDDFKTRLAELVQRPRLVVLASCQSAGDGTGAETKGPGAAFAALGPLLADVGVPAVLAMQDKVTMATVEKFMPCFFEELRRDGQIDRAMAVARGEVRGHSDWWVPVLFMRLKSGRVGWYETGFGTGKSEDEFDRWQGLLGNIEDGHCTPILGPGLLESLVGPAREIARRWGEDERYKFPMAPQNRDDLPQIAQYVAISQNNRVARQDLTKLFKQELLTRYAAQLPPEAAALTLVELFSAVGKLRRASEPNEPHRVLAGLNLPVYISANPDNVLADALAEAGKAPQVEMCRWNDILAEKLPPSLPAVYRPSAVKPLVYHPFGHLSEPQSLVLTLDDYLDYMIGIGRDKTRTPSMIPRALADTALLFLGFQIDDWSFRVLFRNIVNQEGRYRSNEYTHVAVQIDPSTGSFIDPDSARRYFNRYFEGANISIYWGSADDFAKDLQAKIKEYSFV